MADYYKLSGTANRHTDWTTEVVLARNEEGNPTKVVSATRSADLSAEDRKKVESLGYSLVSGTKEESDNTSTEVTDVTGAAPVFGVSDAEMAPESDKQDSGDKSKSTQFNDKK